MHKFYKRLKKIISNHIKIIYRSHTNHIIKSTNQKFENLMHVAFLQIKKKNK